MEAGTQLQPRVKTDNTWGRRLYNGKNYLYFWSVLYAVSFLVNAAAYSTRKFSSFAGVQSGKWLDGVVIKGTLLFCLSNTAWVVELVVLLLFDLDPF